LKKAGNTRKFEDMNTTSYPSDLSITQWNILEALLPSKSSTGRPREHALRDIVNAILYVLYEGCRWRSLPKEYPKWQTVYAWFRRWRNDGTLEKIRRHLVAETRQKMGRNAEPSAGIIDTQTVKTASYAHRDAGYDSAKKIKGRKRSIVTDTQGLLLAVVVMSASSSENQCGFMVLRRLHECYAGIRLVWCDAGFKATLILLAFSLWQIVLDVVPRTEKGFVPLAWRWVVERTFAWLSSARRLAKDYERLPASHQAFVEIAMIRLLLQRLTTK
jgi:putative transposase